MKLIGEFSCVVYYFILVGNNDCNKFRWTTHVILWWMIVSCLVFIAVRRKMHFLSYFESRTSPWDRQRLWIWRGCYQSRKLNCLSIDSWSCAVRSLCSSMTSLSPVSYQHSNIPSGCGGSRKLCKRRETLRNIFLISRMWSYYRVKQFFCEWNVAGGGLRVRLYGYVYIFLSIEHESRDLSCLISSVMQLILDPRFRTAIGFFSLIQKEWIAGGHAFHSGYLHTSPLFLLFLDVVFQLCNQNPFQFEFNDTLLHEIWDATFDSTIGTFLFDSPKQRKNLVRP